MSLGMKPENFQSELSGKHRTRESVRAIRYPNKWGETFPEREAQFADWFDIAMQVIGREKGSFRVIAIFDQVFDWVDGACFETNETIARKAGRCTVKTVSRELKSLRDMGLIATQPMWIEKEGKLVKGRRIMLTVPYDLSGIDVG